jgi:hypothetical protein
VVFSKDRNVIADIKARLEQELALVTPQISMPAPQIVQVNGEPLVVLRIPGRNAPIALYDGAGYCWKERQIRPICINDVFKRYLTFVGMFEAARSTSGKVQMLYGELRWPIRPPAEQSRGYEIQRQAMAWSTRPFQLREGTEELRCALPMLLRHALVEADGVHLRPVANREGTIILRINGKLASGTKVTHQNGGSYVDLPVVSHTYLHLALKIDALELFKRRRRMSLLRFQIPDVFLDPDRIADLKKACADLGFRISDPGDSEDNMAIFEGIRSQGFCDISLLAWITGDLAPVVRDFLYEQRTDIKDMRTATLDIRIVLWGNGENASSEIAALQLNLYDLISRRLQYLHTV